MDRSALLKVIKDGDEKLFIVKKLMYALIAKRQGREGLLPVACSECGCVPTKGEIERGEGLCTARNCEGTLAEAAPQRVSHSVGLEHDQQDYGEDNESSRDRTGPSRSVADDEASELDADGRRGPRRAGRRGIDSDPGFMRGGAGRLDGAKIRTRAKRAGAGRLDGQPITPLRKKRPRIF